MRYLERFFYMSKFALAMLLRAVMTLVAVLCRLLGVRPPAVPPLPVPSTTAEDVRDEYRDAFTRETANDYGFASDLGRAVHQYATATDPGVRCAVDLQGLSMTQMDWLLGLSDDDLQRLATAGPKACELAVSGRKCGVVGLPAPQKAPAPAVVDKGAAVRETLVDRIRAAGPPELAA